MKPDHVRGIVLILVLLSIPLLGPRILSLGVLQPGFEGAKCFFHGVEFRFNPTWEGTYQVHRYQDAEEPLVKNDVWGDVHRIYWETVATPNDAALGWRSFDHVEKPALGFHVESNIALEDITRQGDPLGWNETDPDDARRIEYWSKKVEKIEDTDEKVVYHYTYEKESFFMAPAEFWIGIYLVPSQKDARTGSGWREGEWQNIVAWFKLDWHIWDNAYRDPWLDDPEVNVFEGLYEGQILNQKKTHEYRGGFPIAAWIQGWEKAGWEKMSWEEGAVNDPQAESPRWLQTRGKENEIYSVEELADLKDKLMAKLQLSPGLIGQFLSLYDEASPSFEYESPASMRQDTELSDNEDLLDYVKAPDSRMKKTMYFPINIQNFGTYADGDWWSGWRIFYPSCYLRIRIIYGVHGSFTYLWTEEVKKDPLIDYPDDIERHGTIVIHTPGPGEWFAGIGAWMLSPWGIASGLLFVAAIVLAIIILINPGIILALFKLKGGRRR